MIQSYLVVDGITGMKANESGLNSFPNTSGYGTVLTSGLTKLITPLEGVWIGTGSIVQLWQALGMAQSI